MQPETQVTDDQAAEEMTVLVQSETIEERATEHDGGAHEVSRSELIVSESTAAPGQSMQECTGEMHKNHGNCPATSCLGILHSMTVNVG